MWYVVAVVVQLVLVWWLAQKWKGYVGIVWVFIAIALDAGILWFMDQATAPGYRAGVYQDTIGHDIAMALFVIGGSTLLTGIAIASLPKRRREP